MDPLSSTAPRKPSVLPQPLRPKPITLFTGICISNGMKIRLARGLQAQKCGVCFVTHWSLPRPRTGAGAERRRAMLMHEVSSAHCSPEGKEVPEFYFS